MSEIVWKNDFNIGNYFMPITLKPAPSPTPQNYRRKVIAVVKAKTGITTDKKGFITINNKDALSEYTDNEEVGAFFDAGMDQIYLANVDSISDANDILEDKITKYFTIAISSDFTDEEKVDLEIPDRFNGGIINNTTDLELATAFAGGLNQGCSCDKTAYNFFYMVGLVLSDLRGLYNKYGMALNKVGYLQTTPQDYLNNRLSFIISNSESGQNKLAGLFLGGRPFTTPYILDEIKVGMQDKWVEYRAREDRVKKSLLQANLVQKTLQKYLNQYVETEDHPERPLSFGNVNIDMENPDDYILNCSVEISKMTDIIQLLTELAETN